MSGAAATPSHEYISYIFYHNNNPRWKETFKVCLLLPRQPSTLTPSLLPLHQLVIPFEKVPDAHLRIVLRHLAKDECTLGHSLSRILITNSDPWCMSPYLAHNLFLFCLSPCATLLLFMHTILFTCQSTHPQLKTSLKNHLHLPTWK